MRLSNNLGLDLFPDPISHFWPMVAIVDLAGGWGVPGGTVFQLMWCSMHLANLNFQISPTQQSTKHSELIQICRNPPINSKKNWVQKILGSKISSKKFLVQKKCYPKNKDSKKWIKKKWPQNILCRRKFDSKNMDKKILVEKKNLVPKIFGSKEVWSRKSKAPKIICPQILVKFRSRSVTARILPICTNVALTNVIPLKFSQNQVINYWHIPDMDNVTRTNVTLTNVTGTVGICSRCSHDPTFKGSSKLGQWLLRYCWHWVCVLVGWCMQSHFHI